MINSIKGLHSYHQDLMKCIEAELEEGVAGKDNSQAMLLFSHYTSVAAILIGQCLWQTSWSCYLVSDYNNKGYDGGISDCSALCLSFRCVVIHCCLDSLMRVVTSEFYCNVFLCSWKFNETFSQVSISFQGGFLRFV